MAHLLIIELPGGNDTDLLQAALDRGDEFTFLTAQLDHYRRQTAVWAMLGAARQRIEVGDFGHAEVEQQVLAAHAERRFDALLCLVEIRLVEAAQLAKRLGVRHISPASAMLLRDKGRVRRRLAQHGIAQPEFALAESNAGLRAAVRRLGLPVLIKPADGYGSQNIVALRESADLDPLLSPLYDMLPCCADYGLGVRANDRLLVERYMEGSVIGCDTLSVAGRHRLLGIHDKRMFAPPSFAIRGSSFTPACADDARCRAIEREVGAMLDAVGFDWGATHTELMLTDDGPRLIEINPRLVGAKISRLVGHALGRSLHADLIDVHLGAMPAGDPQAPAAGAGVIRWIVADRPGRLAEVRLPACTDPAIRCVEILQPPGAWVRPPQENADRIGYVMACAESRAHAERLADAFIAQTQVMLDCSAAA